MRGKPFTPSTRRNYIHSLMFTERVFSVKGCSRGAVLLTHFTEEMASLQRHIPYTPKAPIRQGVYSQAVVVDRTMYISGQLGLDVASGQLVEGGVQAQAKQALVNMGEILKTAGCTYDNVVKTTVLLADMNDFNNVNEMYKQFFSKNFPARAAYQVVALPRGGLVEIEAVAVLGPLSDL